MNDWELWFFLSSIIFLKKNMWNYCKLIFPKKPTALTTSQLWVLPFSSTREINTHTGREFATIDWPIKKMVLEIMEPNTCIRGCCHSQTIPLHLPPSSYSLSSPIARGTCSKLADIPLFFSHESWFFLLRVIMQVQRAWCMRPCSTVEEWRQRSQFCLLPMTSISFIRSCSCLGQFLLLLPSLFL